MAATARHPVEMGTIGVLGATSWGTTLAWLLAANGHAVKLLCRTPEEAESVDRLRGIARLPEVHLPANAAAALAATPGPLDGCVLAVPAQTLATNLADCGLDRATPVVNAAKGIELATGRRPSEVIAAAGWSPRAIAIVSGPNLAHEVAKGQPAAAVVASTSMETALWWQHALSGPTFRCYRSTDVIGVELGAASKNVIAIAAGAALGMGFGANTMSSLITRGLAEMTRLVVAAGGDAETMRGLAGLGDLTATCFSTLSRNNRLGSLLAKGRTTQEAIREIGETVEGAATAPALAAMARHHQVELPITAEVAAVIAGERTVGEAMVRLLSRDLTIESA
ncbi:MAG: NAD(P)H-dependent glycerol-3-phosphate dehydrogenase [Dehalococcoidia bacterium]